MPRCGTPRRLSLCTWTSRKALNSNLRQRDLPCESGAVESDREFGLSVLERIDEELVERGEIFRRLGVQNLQGIGHPDQPAASHPLGNR